jgi:hypothetical protein
MYRYISMLLKVESITLKPYDEAIKELEEV